MTLAHRKNGRVKTCQSSTVLLLQVGVLLWSRDPFGAGGAASGLGHAPPGAVFVFSGLAVMLDADEAAGGHEAPREREGRRTDLEAPGAEGTTP